METEKLQSWILLTSELTIHHKSLRQAIGISAYPLLWWSVDIVIWQRIMFGTSLQELADTFFLGRWNWNMLKLHPPAPNGDRRQCHDVSTHLSNLNTLRLHWAWGHHTRHIHFYPSQSFTKFHKAAESSWKQLIMFMILVKVVLCHSESHEGKCSNWG